MVAQADLDTDNMMSEDSALVRPETTSCGRGICSTTSKTAHWHTTEEAKNAVAEADIPTELGQSIHVYQDSYSHWQKLGEPDTSGEIWDKHATNQIETLRCRYTPMCDVGSVYIDDYDPRRDPIDQSLEKNLPIDVGPYVKQMANNILERNGYKRSYVPYNRTE